MRLNDESTFIGQNATIIFKINHPPTERIINGSGLRTNYLARCIGSGTQPLCTDTAVTHTGILDFRRGLLLVTRTACKAQCN